MARKKLVGRPKIKGATVIIRKVQSLAKAVNTWATHLPPKCK